ncbi:hypothetical protein Tsubulata_027861 [Turnera subulata]|uniref:Uncharacterized protein n=1 Tax=Turnera subulata TaxID=218843 RepID=A0A9Q0FE19_9ROSI|nr:hypothetical protein Tsubulata_027861 [Turnera subulata]
MVAEVMASRAVGGGHSGVAAKKKDLEKTTYPTRRRRHRFKGTGAHGGANRGARGEIGERKGVTACAGLGGDDPGGAALVHRGEEGCSDGSGRQQGRRDGGGGATTRLLVKTIPGGGEERISESAAAVQVRRGRRLSRRLCSRGGGEIEEGGDGFNGVEVEEDKGARGREVGAVAGGGDRGKKSREAGKKRGTGAHGGANRGARGEIGERKGATACAGLGGDDPGGAALVHRGEEGCSDGSGRQQGRRDGGGGATTRLLVKTIPGGGEERISESAAAVQVRRGRRLSRRLCSRGGGEIEEGGDGFNGVEVEEDKGARGREVGAVAGGGDRGKKSREAGKKRVWRRD